MKGNGLQPIIPGVIKKNAHPRYIDDAFRNNACLVVYI